MSLSFLRMPTTSSVIDFTRTSGAGCWACATGISNAKSQHAEILMAMGFLSLGGFIIGLLAFPRWIAIVHEVATALQPGLAHEAVFVERRLVNNARGVEEVGAIVDRARSVERVVHRNSVYLENEVGLRIEDQAETVADRRGPQERQNQIRPAADAPPAQCLPEILIVLLQPEVGSEVENAGDPERRIENDASEIVEPLLKLALQHIVHRDPDVLEIGKEIGNPRAQDSRHDPAVTPGHGPDHGPVHRIVEAEHRAVQRLERVRWIARRGGAARKRPGEEQRRTLPLGPCHALGFQSCVLTSCRRLRRLYCTGTDRSDFPAPRQTA